MEAACDIFYSIYGDSDGRQPDIINNVLCQLDFHALSIALLATTASQNAWDYHRLVKEWETSRTQVLQTHFSGSLATTLELSLRSPMFRDLGPSARDLLGVIAFFPQGVDENNLDWLFPSISNGKDIFDKFCALSLTRRSNGFITMLAPIRDYLGPQDPESSSLLRATKDHYVSRLSVDLNPDEPGFEEARWIVSENVNVEHLLNTFTSTKNASGDIWDVCCHFMEHLYWYKPRQTVLKPKFEGLPDDHPSKLVCLLEVSKLFQGTGNHKERKQLLIYVVMLGRQRGDNIWVANALRHLSDVNWQLGLYEEGIQQAEQALEIFK
jgi:hypothetical protein